MSLTDATPLALSLIAIVISVLAYIETVRTRKLQEAQYHDTKSARLRVSDFVFEPADTRTIGLKDVSDTIGMELRNIGEAPAFDIDISVERAGVIRYHGEVYGLPPTIKMEAKVPIGTVEETTVETIVITARYRDHMPHVAEITLQKGISSHYPHSSVVPHVIKATLDGRPHPDIALGGRFPRG